MLSYPVLEWFRSATRAPERWSAMFAQKVCASRGSPFNAGESFSPVLLSAVVINKLRSCLAY